MDWYNKTLESQSDLNRALFEIKKDIAKKDNAYFDDNGNILFTLNTKFRWGRHKGNKLSDVFKVEPYYIQWAIECASGIGIYEPDLLKLLKTTCFLTEDLNKICLKNGNEISLDLQSLKRDSNGFLIGGNLREESHSIPNSIIESNKHKILKGLDFMRGYQNGLPSEKEISSKIFYSPGIKVKLNVPC